MCVCLFKFSALSRRVGALQISIIIIIKGTRLLWCEPSLCVCHVVKVKNAQSIVWRRKD